MAILAHDWSGTPMGPIDAWRQPLKAIVAMMVHSPVPMALLWGEQGILLYNDGYVGILGDKHPAALGRQIVDVWPEAAEFNANVVRTVMAGEPLAYRNASFLLNRNGQQRHCWFDLDYSPLFDEGDIVGTLALVVEKTEFFLLTKQIEQERSQFAELFEQAPTFMAVLRGPEHRFERLNPGYAELIGHRQVLGKTVAEALPDAAAQGYVTMLDEAFRTGKAISGNGMRYAVQAEPGGPVVERYVDFVCQPIRDAEGIVTSIFLEGVDVTEKKAAEQAARHSAVQFQTLAQALPNHAWTANAEGMLDWLNDRFYEYTGASAGMADGHGWTGFVHADDVDDATVLWHRSVASGAPYETEFRLRRADGEYRWHLVRAFPLSTAPDQVRRWVGTYTDIHERKLLEAQSTRDRDRIWNLSQELMLICDFKGVISAVNPAATHILGWSQDEMTGKSLDMFLHPDDIAATGVEVSKLSAGIKTLAFENRYRARDGSYRLFSWTAVPDGEAIHAVGRDVTRERVAEEALRQSQKLEAIGQLTGGVAHDFNNVLAVMRSAIDLLRLVELSDERRNRTMEAISDSVTRGTKLTGQLLAFARRQVLQPMVFDIRRNIEMIGDMIGSLTGVRIKREMHLPAQACFVHADPNQFDTAIVNLAVNARDAMGGSGRLVVSVSCVNEIPPVRGNAGTPGQFVAVTVSDTGVGIPEENLTRIFEPFFTTKGTGQGTGLGLSQVFGFAKQSGGDILVDSRLGEGTTFTIYLPRVSAPDRETDVAPSAGRFVQGRGGCILAVEDNPDVAMSVVQTLEELGYTPVLVSSAEQALRELAENSARFDLVFSDVVMTGMNGFELGNQIRRLYPALPVVLSTGYSEVLLKNPEHGFRLLPKPYTLEALTHTLNEALHGVGEPGR